MPLSDTVYVERRFQRSIRIDTDLQDPDALTGFICPESSASVLTTMSSHIKESGQAAFTWTGPYGSGKSSLVIALSALTAKSKSQRERAKRAVGEVTAEKIWDALPPGKQGWTVIPVVGQRASARKVIGDALISHGLAYIAPEGGWTDDTIVQTLLGSANNIRGKSGIILFIDEMGKFLESAARDGSDLYLFQQIAEIASRSNGKLVVVGILHQAFAEYANRLSRDARDEWSKIQGRFVDLAVNTAGEEQIDLLARAIHSDHNASSPGYGSKVTADTIRSHKPGVSKNLANLLENTWPLHPVVAALLGPISRRRFGQNQRSLFGFLNSAEPNGFQDYLKAAKGDETYLPARLWDYLRINLEPSIIASPDGHRWAMAAEAIDRCEANGGSSLHIELLKTIAVLDLFRERSGLYPSRELLCTTVSNNADEVESALDDLRRWSFVIYRKHLSSFAIYAGSDFDIEAAVERALQDVRDVDFDLLHKMAGIQPILAKRHYFRTGALRWFDVQLGTLTAVSSTAVQFQPHQGTIGLYLLALPTEGETSKEARDRCKEASKKAAKAGHFVITGYPQQAWRILELSKELKALEKVRETHPEIQGDLVAQREINSRLLDMQNQLEAELQQALLHTIWFENGSELFQLQPRELNNKASDIADKLYYEAPRLPNELLNRTKPSSSAIAAQNGLLRAMANNRGEERLGIQGYPAEGGLFDSILAQARLYTEENGLWNFRKPNWEDDPANLQHIWSAASDFLEERSDRAIGLDEIFDLWELPPYGLKRGLMPILGVAYIMSNSENLAFYREGIFQSGFTDLDVDYLAKDPKSIQVRWMDLGSASKGLLSGLAEVVRELDQNNPLTELAPIDVARGLVAIFDQLPNWTKRTQRISSSASKVRSILKYASDPNQLLFSDLPSTFRKSADIQDEETCKGIVEHLKEALTELVDAYPKMLNRMLSILLNELQVPSDSPQAIRELQERAENIEQMSGDFRLDAFSNRIAVLDGSLPSIEGVGSLAANKPPRDWVDADLDSAFIEIAELSQKFIRTETYARVQGRKDKRHSMAVIISKDGHPTPVQADFQITDSDRAQVDELLALLKQSVLTNKSQKKAVILAALAELSSEYMSLATDTEQLSFLEDSDATA